MSRISRPRLVPVLLINLALLATGAARAAELTVSAAASLTEAFRAVGSAFEAAHAGDKVQFNFAASDALLQQLAAGAPVDVLATADQVSMDKAAAQKLIADDSRRDFARNELVLIAPAGNAQRVQGLADLARADLGHVAIGNPASVPAGRYAQQALEKAGLWPLREGRAVFAQSVRQALDYTARGEVDAALVYRTDANAQADKVTMIATVPTDTPIVYPVAVVAASKQNALARSFVAFLTSDAGRELLAARGFKAP